MSLTALFFIAQAYQPRTLSGLRTASPQATLGSDGEGKVFFLRLYWSWQEGETYDPVYERGNYKELKRLKKPNWQEVSEPPKGMKGFVSKYISFPNIFMVVTSINFLQSVILE